MDAATKAAKQRLSVLGLAVKAGQRGARRAGGGAWTGPAFSSGSVGFSCTPSMV